MEILPSNTRLSRYPKARVVRALREQGWGAAKKARGAPGSSEPTSTSPTCPHRGGRRIGTRSPRRGWTTATRSALTGKALIDGITSAGTFASDSRKHVRKVTYELSARHLPPRPGRGAHHGGGAMRTIALRPLGRSGGSGNRAR